jgi:hypothetical protein
MALPERRPPCCNRRRIVASSIPVAMYKLFHDRLPDPFCHFELDRWPVFFRRIVARSTVTMRSDVFETQADDVASSKHAIDS